MVIFYKQSGYSKMSKEDPEETQHRLAQFLIYKALQKADSRRRPSWFRVKVCKLKIKIGKKLKKLRGGFSCSVYAVKADFYRQVSYLLRSWKLLIQGKPQGQQGSSSPTSVLKFSST